MGQNLDRYREFVQRRSEHPPPVVFRYTTYERARELLSSRKVRALSPRNFNDPFDAQWDPFWQYQSPEFREAYARYFTQMLNGAMDVPADGDPHYRKLIQRERAKLPALPDNDRAEAIRAMTHDMRGRFQHDDVDRIRDSIMTRMRIFCVSAAQESPLLWSHYGASHRGVVLALRTSILEEAWEIPLQPVTYRDRLPRIIDAETAALGWASGVIQIRSAETLFEVWSLTKAQCWAYEEEWRFVSLVNDQSNTSTWSEFSLPNDVVSAVVGGCRSDRVQLEELRETASPWNRQLEAYQMEPTLGRFSVSRRSP